MTIRTKEFVFHLEEREKHGFSDKTLHMRMDLNLTTAIGTEFILEGESLKKQEMEEAKLLFLAFSPDANNIIETTQYGQVIRLLQTSQLSKMGSPSKGKIYIRGVLVNEEDNLLFTYNITSITKKIEEKLNRERRNIGREAYRDRIISILEKTSSKEIRDIAANQIEVDDSVTCNISLIC